MSSKKRRLACGIGAAFAAGAGFTTLAATAASANSHVTAKAGISVPADTTGAPAVLVASLEGRNEVTAGSPNGQALEVIGLHDNTLTYAISWRGIGRPSEADIHTGARGVDGPVVVSLFTTPRSGGFASGTVTVNDPTVLAALRHDPANPAFNPSLRQLVHVGFKIAAQMGDRYLKMVEACEATIARNVTSNLFDRHLKPLFVG